MKRGAVALDGIDVPTKPKWTGSTALVHVPVDRCPTCDGELRQPEGFEQPALIRHGGFGATTRTVRVSCAGCGWSLVRERSEINPRVR